MWTSWRTHFETNACRPLPGAPTDIDRLPPTWRGPLGASLARFQLGEAGEGRIAREIQRARIPGIDADYCAALALFVKEEGRHARILAGMVRSLGGELLHDNWSERLFVSGRRLLGLRCKLLVLLVAEVVGLVFYGALARRLGQCTIAEQLRQISDDEARHLEFHVDFFRTQMTGPAARALFRAAWWPIAGLACAVLLLDHGKNLRALAITRGEVARGLLRSLAEVDRRVLGSQQITVTASA